MRELHLFAGAGGGILGGMLLGHTCVCAVEIDEYCRKVLLQRQRDGILPRFPIWDDVRTFDARPWNGKVDIVCGGFPCQDISSAGKGAGINGERSGLWSEMARIIGVVRPSFVFVENSPLLVNRGLTSVLSDLAKMGFDATWGVIGARNIGGVHSRDRLWIVASSFQDTNPLRRDGKVGRDMARSRREHESAAAYLAGSANSEPWILGSNHGVANLMDRLAAIGNGQVPAVVKLAWETLSQ